MELLYSFDAPEYSTSFRLCSRGQRYEISVIRIEKFFSSSTIPIARSQDANLREDPHWQDHHPGGGALRHHR